MNDRALIRAGTVGAVIGAICCATPTLAVLLSVVGLGAWLAKADFVVIPMFLLSLGLVAVGLFRRRVARRAHCDAEPINKGVK